MATFNLLQVPDVEDDPSRDILFPKGLPGFGHLHRFHLMIDPSYSPPFEFLLSDEESDVGFYLVDPALIRRDYAPEISEADLHEVQPGSEDPLVLRAIVTLGSDVAGTTVNLAAPLVLNFATGLGCQVILEDTRYSVRTPIDATAQ